MRVSVVMPAYNRGYIISEALESVLTQTFQDFEVMVIDDGSTDNTGKIVERLSDSRVRYIRHQKNAGYGAAINTGLTDSRGELVSFLDSEVSGIITNYTLPPLLFRLWQGVFARGPFRDDRQKIYWMADRLHNAGPVRVSRLGGGLMSFRAEAVRGLRFDDNLRGVSDGEDVEFCARLGRGTILMVAPRARLAHKKSPSGRNQNHWLRPCTRSNYYLHYRVWKRGLTNRLFFLWLNVGLGLVASIASARRGSLAPWRALLDGAREGRKASTRFPS